MTSSSTEQRFVEAYPRTGTAAAATFVSAQPTGVATPARPAETVSLDSHVTLARFDIDLSEHPTLPGDVATRLRAEAQAAGYAVGWADGRREAEQAERKARVDAEARSRQ